MSTFFSGKQLFQPSGSVQLLGCGQLIRTEASRNLDIHSDGQVELGQVVEGLSHCSVCHLLTNLNLEHLAGESGTKEKKTGLNHDSGCLPQKSQLLAWKQSGSFLAQ